MNPRFVQLIVLGSLALSPLRASAAATPIDVSNDSIQCLTLTATHSPKPAFVTGGTAATTIKVKGELGRCVVTGANPAKIVSGKFSGTLTGTNNNCIGWYGSPLTGTLTIKWKADPTTPIVQTSSVVTITSVVGSVFAVPWGGPYLQHSFVSSGVTGAFTGGDGGAMSSNNFFENTDYSGCQSTGVKKFILGPGQFTLS